VVADECKPDGSYTSQQRWWRMNARFVVVSV
jgi:hypothetical protein